MSTKEVYVEIVDYLIKTTIVWTSSVRLLASPELPILLVYHHSSQTGRFPHSAIGA